MKYTPHAAVLTAATSIVLLTGTSLAYAQSDPMADLFQTGSSTQSATSTPAAAAPAAPAAAPAATPTAASTTPVATPASTPAASTSSTPSAAAGTGAMHAAAPSAKAYLADVTNVVTTPGPKSVTLTWDAVTGADGYTVYYSKKSVDKEGGEYENTAPVKTGTTFTASDLDPTTAYYFAITAEDSTGKTRGSEFYSKEVSATTLAASAATSTLKDAATKPAATQKSGVADSTSADTKTPDATKLPQTGTGLEGAVLAALGAGWVVRRGMKKYTK